jgi:hypoxanthine phosphoribosyltransferase
MVRKFPCELVSWGRIHRLGRLLALRTREAGFRPEIIVAIGRGGLIPGRILADYLDLMKLTSFKIEHYMGAHKQPVAQVKYPLCADLTGARVLVVDDVSDTGDTFRVAIEHIYERSQPAEIKSAVLHHKTVSTFEPDFYAQKVVKWRWIIYPWAIMEDITGFLKRMEARPATLEGIAGQLELDYGIRVPRHTLEDALALIEP